MRANPIGSSFLALGTFLLMESEGESYEQYLRSQSGVIYRDYKGKVSETTQRLSETVGEVTQEVRAKTQNLVERGGEQINRVRDTGRDLKEQVRGKLSRNKTSGEEIRNNVIDATESFKERAGNSVDTTEVTSKLSRMKDSVSEFGRNTAGKIKERELDSLTYVALGGSLGFAIGGLIPMKEDISEFRTDFDLSSLRAELEQAANDSMNVFKNEFIDTLKNANIDIF